ncbi:hypothetical protein AVEN_136960-1 [Araneus ventricosus]|uniref:Uncharacterized protein n=1 Tax=Araneus ventricosus TaxID=182803 RepID=A0A4Y2BIE1_ARAVE|nr:hypothetical protein AVEN_136960-1 [Araneus ventricosus]
MGQDRSCRPGDPISPIPDNECALLCPLLCGVLHYRPRTKPFEAYCHSCNQREVFRHPSSPFSALKPALLDQDVTSEAMKGLAGCKELPSFAGHRFLPEYFLGN